MKEGQGKIGFIGQGYVGKNYADDFERRGYEVVRYALEEPYRANKERIKECAVVIIGVPTPTTPTGFDDSIVRSALALLAPGSIAVIKSTVLPGTTKALAEAYPDRIVLYSPEFLSEATAAADVANPFSNIIGMGKEDEAYRAAAARVEEMFPPAPFKLVCGSTEAELVKYSHNGSGYVEIVFFNMMYDLAEKLGVSWEPIQQAIEADPFIARRYAKPVHKSGRGAGGHCFIKDFAALRGLYERAVGDAAGTTALAGLEGKNLDLLRASKKDLDLLAGVYGPEA